MPDAPVPPEVVSIDTRATTPEAAGSVLARGRVVGACPGAVWVELVGQAGERLALGEAHGGSYLLGPVAQNPGGLRWGCDRDGDGLVLPGDAASAEIPAVPLSGAVLLLPEAPATR